MLDSIHVAASGLHGHQRGLKNISSNVSNMNTPGFKGANTQFTDVFLKEAGDHAGANLQTGGGIDLLPSSINFNAGEIRATGRDMDMALDGAGFFVVRNAQGEIFYTKSGRFEFNKDGKLVTMEGGLEVLGRTGDAGLAPIELSGQKYMQSKPTTEVVLKGNLSTNEGTTPAGPDHIIDGVKVYDAGGTLHTLKLEFSVRRITSSGSTTPVPGTWTVKVLDGIATVGTGEVRTAGATADPLANSFTATLSAVTGSSTIKFLLGPEATGFSSADSNLVVATIDGNAEGTISKTTLDETGTVVITYSNQSTAKSGTLAVAEFVAQDDLERATGALFRHVGRNDVRYVELGDSTKLVAGSLELSNIDLTDQFSEMILIQRGFQASSQVLSTASEMIQSLYDLKSRR
ncbi:MAG: flagellar hook-basal body complex protein [Aquabacterium sp.]